MITPILISIKEAAVELGVGRTKKIDKRHLVVHASIGRLIERLAKRAA